MLNAVGQIFHFTRICQVRIFPGFWVHNTVEKSLKASIYGPGAVSKKQPIFYMSFYGFTHAKSVYQRFKPFSNHFFRKGRTPKVLQPGGPALLHTPRPSRHVGPRCLTALELLHLQRECQQFANIWWSSDVLFFVSISRENLFILSRKTAKCLKYAWLLES